MTRITLAKIILGLGVMAVLGSGIGFGMQKFISTKKIKLVEMPTINTADSPVTKLPIGSFRPFGTVRLTPDFFLDGDATNIDSPEFFEADDPQDTLLFVSGKGNNLIEIWKSPFKNNQLAPLKRDSLPNGLDVEQDKNLLLIGDSEKQLIELRSLPDLSTFSIIGENELGKGETNMDTLTLPNGQKHIYVSESRQVMAFDLETGVKILSFTPNVEMIEEILADSYYQIIYIPEENGIESKLHPGGAVTAYHPDGNAYLKNGSNIFGQGLFTGDGEGITLYACRGNDDKDNGQGFIIVANQSLEKNKNRFEFFDRATWEHLGTLILEGVSGTDGIAVTERPLPNYPQGIFAVSNSDENLALISWKKIADAAHLQCAN